MKCPHCRLNFHPEPRTVELGAQGRTEHYRYVWRVHLLACPACHKPVLYLDQRQDYGGTEYREKQWMAYPKTGGRTLAPPEIPEEIARDFNEACVVLVDSPQASAALSRRCLQHLLQERGVSASDNLSKAIDDALASHLPSHIAEDIDAIRNIGNFAAHPQKSVNSGAILPVEESEAEWNLDVLEMLFDFYYVQPTKSAASRTALNEKLKAAGKKPMKEPKNAGGKSAP